MGQVLAETRVTNWPQIRSHYVEAAEQLTYDEVADLFCIPVARVRRAASEEGWPLLRLRRLERALCEADTARTILAVAEGDRLLRDNVRNVAVAGLQAMQAEFADLASAKTDTARRRVIADMMFALLNCTNALKAAGIAVPTMKNRGGNDGEGAEVGEAWARGLMQQLNVAVTVNAPANGVSPSKVSNERPTEAVA